MIKFVLKNKVSEIIDNYCNSKPNERGKFLTVSGNRYVAVDNDFDDAITEDFDNITDAIDWLNGKISMDEYLERVKANV